MYDVSCSRYEIMIQWLMSHPFFEVLSSKMPVLPSCFSCCECNFHSSWTPKVPKSCASAQFHKSFMAGWRGQFALKTEVICCKPWLAGMLFFRRAPFWPMASDGVSSGPTCHPAATKLFELSADDAALRSLVWALCHTGSISSLPC